MASSKKAPPYEEMAELLKRWRSAKYSSALKLFKEAKFSFSYSLYAKFEQGNVLPPMEILIELAEFFQKDPAEAAYLWARLQMPTPALRALFDQPVPAPEMKTPKQETETASQTVAPTFENTWVFGPREKTILLKDPWLWEVCVVLSMAYPEEVKFSELPLPKGVTAKTLTEKQIAPWIQDGFIQSSKTGLKLVNPHLHIPKSPQWNQVGVNNLSRAFDALIERLSREAIDKGEGHRGLIYRPLSRSQLERWIERMKKLEQEFKTEAFVSTSGEDRTYGLLALLGPRKLRK